MKAMRENEFEKQVQQKMKEFDLRPSEEVWMEVEGRIRKEKKRRWIIFWWMLPLLLAGSGVAVYLVNKGSEKNISHKQEQKQPELTVKENSKKDIVIKDQPADKAISKTGSEDRNKIISKKGEKKNTKPGDIVNNKNPDTFFENDGGGLPEWRNRAGKKKIASFLKTENPPPFIAKKEKIAVIDDLQKERQPTMAVTKQKDSAVKTIPEFVSAAPVKSPEQSKETKPEKNIVQFDQTKSVVPASDSAATFDKSVPAIKKNKKGWETGIIAATGLSNRIGGLSIFGANKSFSANTFQVGGPGSGAPQLNKPTDSRSGLYFEAGIYAQKKLKKKTAVSIEFLVSSFSVRQPRGVFIDSVQGLSSADANRSYRTGNSSVYNSRYYYLNIPLMFHWQLNRNSRIPLVWQNGLSPSLLLGSNALVYNRNAGILYRDNNSLNKVQLSFRSGLYAQFGAVSKNPFSAGLFFNYQFTGLQGSNGFDKNHLSSFGIQIRKTLKK
jgi:Outer membrane protein beta-barrel domain